MYELTIQEALAVSVSLGRIGVWTATVAVASSARVRAHLAEIEELGYGAVWYPEGVGTRESLSLAAMLLGWSSRLVVVPGIANVWARDPMAMANGARSLHEAYAGRFLLGLGVSNVLSLQARGHTYSKPVSTMRAYLDAMDDAPFAVPAPEEPPRVLAALGPRMLELAAQRSLGAHPYFVPVEHTAFARERLGKERLLAVEQAVLLEADGVTARAIAREHMAFYLAREPYRANLSRLGWSDDEIGDPPSDRLVDAIVAWGDVEAVRARVVAHLEAGADHVCVQAIRSETELAELRELAPALVEL